jgi:spoIIIJ-associated protein
MIEDLVFKGKSIDEALNKAGNFFGVDTGVLKYEFDDDAPQGEVWIKLTENPILAQKRRQGNTSHAGEPQPQDERFNKADTRGGPRRPHRKPRKQFNRPQSRQPREQQDGYRQRGGGHSRRDAWKPADVDLSTLKDAEKEAHAFVVGVLKQMRMKVDVIPVQDQTRLVFNIDGPDRSLLLNKKGEPLVAIQYLINKIYMGRNGIEQQIYIDSKGYRIARDEELQEIALASAEKVVRSGKEYSLSPMNPYERRQIHVTLKDHTEVETVSRGDGYIKRVSIVPAGGLEQ